MLYLMLLFTVLLLIAEYAALGHDFFQPSCLITASYIFSILCANINKSIWLVKYHSDTFWVIFAGLIAIFFANALAFGKGKHLIKKKQVRSVYIELPLGVYIFIILFQLVALIIYFREVIRITGGGAALAVLMVDFRAETGYLETASVSSVASNMNRFSLLFAFIMTFVFINNLIIDSRKGNIKNLVPVIIFGIQTLLTGGRFNLLRILLAALIMANCLWHRKNGWRSHLKLKYFAIILCLLCCMLVGFYYARILVGRTNDSDLVTYIASYAGGSIPLLDMYLQDPIPKSNIFGEETFYDLIKNLNSLGIINVRQGIAHLEFRTSNGINLGNVYTAFRRHIQDFGFGGMLILDFTWSFLLSYYYKEIKIQQSSNLLVLIYSYLGYSLFLHSINDCFFTGNFSIGGMFNIVMLAIMYYLISKKKFFVKRVSYHGAKFKK